MPLGEGSGDGERGGDGACGSGLSQMGGVTKAEIFLALHHLALSFQTNITLLSCKRGPHYTIVYLTITRRVLSDFVTASVQIL